MEAKEIPIKVTDLPIEIDMYTQGYKAGRREVVEWIKGCTRTRDCFQEDGSIAYRAGDIIMTKVLWQAKLKEWGVSGAN